MNMDAPMGNQAKGRPRSNADAKTHDPQPTSDPQPTTRSESAPSALTLPVPSATSEALTVPQSDLTTPRPEASLLQKSSTERVESPPPEIVKIRKVPHTTPQMPNKITANTFTGHSPSSQSMPQPKCQERKRRLDSPEETLSKRQMLPSTSIDALPTQVLRSSTVHSAPSADNDEATLSDTLSSTLSDPLSDTHLPSPQRSQGPAKRWSARTWTARQYHDMANMAERGFPFHAFMLKHNKTEKEVFEVFNGVIRTPQLLQAQRGVGLARGGLGEERMKEYRKMEKETIQNVRAEAEQEKKHEEEEDRRKKEKPKKEALCDDCKKKKVTGGPKSIAEAREAKDAKLREFTQAQKVYDRMVDKERKEREEAAKATNTSTNLTRRTPKSAAPATSK